MGEWIDLDAPVERPAPIDLPEVSSGGWVTSSFDLLRGTDVSDDPDTVPGELLDELFAPPGAPKKVVLDSLPSCPRPVWLKRFGARLRELRPTMSTVTAADHALAAFPEAAAYEPEQAAEVFATGLPSE